MRKGGLSDAFIDALRVYDTVDAHSIFNPATEAAWVRSYDASTGEFPASLI